MISRCRASPPPKKSRIFQKMEGGSVTKVNTVYIFNIDNQLTFIFL
jgi:hypothetical protein